MTNMREAFIQSRRLAAERAVLAGKTIVVMGVRPGNLPEAIWAHPQIEPWSSDDYHRHRTIPRKTGLILTTRFQDHGTLERIGREAKRMQVDFMANALTTGELRVILEPVLTLHPDHNGHPPAPPPDDAGTSPVLHTMARMVKKGDLRNFIDQEANLDAAVLVEEAQRLWPIAKKMGLDTTVNSLCQGIRTARFRRSIQPPPAPPTPAPMTARVVHVEPSAPVPVPQPAPEPVVPLPSVETRPLTTTAPATATSPLGTGEEEVLRLFDDAIAAMTLARERFLALQQSSSALKARLLAMANELS